MNDYVTVFICINLCMCALYSIFNCIISLVNLGLYNIYVLNILFYWTHYVIAFNFAADMQDAANMLSMDSSSSVESLPSSRSTSTPSGTPLSSPTPSSISPQGRVKRSLFNPAEMERMRNFQQQQLIKQVLKHSSFSKQLEGDLTYY